MNKAMEPRTNGKDPDAFEGIEVSRLLSKFKDRWKLYALAILAALTITFLYNTYSTQRYKVVSTLLNSTEHVSTALGEIEDQQDPNMLNELEILRSTELMQRAIEQGDLFYKIYEPTLFDERAFEEAQPLLLDMDILDPEARFDLLVDFTFTDNGSIFIDASNTELIEAGYTYSLPFKASSEILAGCISANEGMNPESGSSYTLKIIDPLSMALELKEAMKVELTNSDATVLRIEMESSDPQWAVKLVGRLINDYRNLKIEHKNESIINSLHFINGQVDLIKKRLNRIEYDVVRFRELNKTIDIDAEGSAVLSTLLDLENELAAKRLQMNYYTQLMDQMNSSDSNQVFVNPSAVGIKDPVFNNAVNSLNTMILDLNQLRSSSTEINPRFKSLELSIGHQIDLLKSSINDYKASTALSIGQLEERIRDEEREMKRLPTTRKNLMSLQREFDINETMYLFLEERRTEAEILKASNISQVQVIDSPYVHSKVFPRDALNYVIALVIAALFVYFATTAYDLNVQRIDTPDDLTTKTQLPLIGSIPDTRTVGMRPGKESLSSEVMQSFRRMTTHFRNGHSDRKILQVFSASNKEGRTFVAVNLAVMLAKYQHKVVLVDANLRSPTVSKVMSVKTSSSLKDHLNDKKELKDIITPTKIENLDVIGGTLSKDGEELFNTLKLSRLLKSLKKQYDYVIVDTAPLLPYPDALDVQEFADYKLFVVSKSYTPISALDVLTDIGGQDPGDKLGLVFNQQRHQLT